MIELLIIVAIAAGAFIGTNLDNLLLLVTFYSRYPDHTATVTGAYAAGMLLIGVLCVIIGEGGGLIPIDYLGLLGIVPISIGAIGLLQLFRKPKDNDVAQRVAGNQRKAVFLAVMLTQLSNGADTIITFSVFLADSTDRADYFIIPTFFVMVLLFSALARFALKHPRLKHFLDRFGRYITPLILVLVGWYILSDTASDLR